MSSDTERDAASFPSGPGKPGDTEKDLVSPAQSPGLRVIAGGKAEPEAAPESEPRRRRKPIDKSKRPAHLQLRLITVPPWLPWLAHLMAERQKTRDGTAETTNRSSPGNTAPSGRQHLGVVLLVLFVLAGIAAAGLWRLGSRPASSQAVTRARASNAQPPKAGPIDPGASEPPRPRARSTAAAAPRPIERSPATSQPAFPRREPSEIATTENAPSRASLPEHTKMEATPANAARPASEKTTPPAAPRSPPPAAETGRKPAATIKASPKGIDDWAL